jgi:hypothetical protein
LESVSFDFATESGVNAPLTLSAFENNTLVGSLNFPSAVPPGKSNSEGVASFTGEFNMLELSSSQLIAIDNIATPAIPEPKYNLLLAIGLVGFVLLQGHRSLAAFCLSG